MKHLVKILFALLLVFYSCSQQVDEVVNREEFSNEFEMHPVGVSISRASIETFVEQGITEIGIYVYLKDSMVYGKNLLLNGGNLRIELPLGESLQTFAVANADHLIDADSLSTVVVYQDLSAQKEVYISDVKNFTSDYSSANLSLELKRMVGQAIFQPAETAETLSNITEFDRLSLTFTNVGVAYKVQAKECVLQDITLTADKAAGFSASVYSFPTVDTGSRTSVDVVYIKGGSEVNRTNSPLDAGIAFEASKRSTVYMPVLEEAYLENEWTATRSAARTANDVVKPLFTIEESEF